MKLNKYFSILAIALGILALWAGDDTAKKSPFSDKALAEWWKAVATQNFIARQISEAQNTAKTASYDFVKNDGVKKSLEATLAKDCEAIKKDFLLDPQSGEPTCVDKPKSEAKKEEVKKK